MRRDARRSREAILAAVGSLLAERGPGFTLTDAAQRAEVSTATAYRHFASADEAIAGYFGQLTADLVEAFDAIPGDADPEEGIRRLCAEWAGQAADWGAAAVYLRSPRGYLARLGDGDPFITALCQRLEGALRKAILAGAIPDQDLRYATLIWVTLFDERVIVDLIHGHGLTPAQAASRLTATLLAALRAHA
jgi:AcrR family transcriptional regulator